MLRDDGLVRSRACFPGGREFQYLVESSPASVRPSASLSECIITVRLPETMVQAWADSDQVSISGEQMLDSDVLTILVEKDFACLAPREGEDESDMYPHPATKAAADED